MRIAVASLSMAIAVTPTHAQTSNLNGAVALSSQLVDRGLAITPVTPFLQAAGSWTSANGWVLGLSAGTPLRSTGHGSEALAQVGHYWSLADDWRMQAGLVYYTYPGNARARAFDRAEASINWMYRDVLTFGLSAIRLTRGSNHQPRGAADVDFHWPLPAHFSVSAGVGVAQPLSTTPYYGSSTYGSHEAWGYYYGGGYYPYRRPRTSSYYGYGHLGLAWTYQAWRVELDRVATDPSQRSLAAAPWVATIAWSF
ncbi:hypothetical protein [Dyella choica]|uniref:MipA/OmpV family protein n=1 Tax=Dyella choica TaxID=1927959 RepID=A0A432M107_9GAMM|nr:hypothetical protein [Dyella choica]RUL70917.1 hypothetical protein EKH80_20075 [Dyella choica]